MNKKVVIWVVAVVVVAAVAVAGYLIFIKGDSKDLSSDASQAEETSLLGETTSTSPMDNKPDLNPADKSNPFRSIKTNPFE